jgi:hypothetical protein
MVTDEKIRILAYSIWEQEGCPQGKDVEHYLRAKKIIEQQEALAAIELAPLPPVVELPSPKPLSSLPPAHKKNIRNQHKKK